MGYGATFGILGGMAPSPPLNPPMGATAHVQPVMSIGQTLRIYRTRTNLIT